MTDFAYRAFDTKGHMHEGRLSADDEQKALNAVRALGYTPLSLTKGADRNTFARFLPQFDTKSQLSRTTRERYLTSLATMLDAGFLLSDCHRFLANDTGDKTLAQFCKSLLDQLQAGQTLSASLRASNGGFDMAQLAAITAGEKSGNLAPPLRHVAETLRTNNANREKLISAMIYPAILVLTSLGSIVVIATVLAPNLLPIFEGREQDMPTAMRLLIDIQSFMTENFALVILTFLCSLFLLRYVARLTSVRLLWERMLRKIGLVRKLEAAQIAGSLALMLRGGTTLLDAIRLCAANAGSLQSRTELNATAEAIAEGAPFREAVRQIALFELMDIQMLSVAENANRLEPVLEHVAATNNTHAMRQLERIMGLLTPVMTLLMGLLIGGLIYTVMRSILSINQLAQ
jgi:general secretion pathway protein F